MKACILAGGEGRRLRPLTSFLPKPLVSVLGKPVLHHIVERLKSFDITEMAVTLMYLPDMVKNALGDGSDMGVSIHYFTEETPLGTAGGVKACQTFLEGDDFLVISGDGLCDFDLSEALAFHRQKKADVTVILTPQSHPLEYGLVQIEDDGRITRFAEKPAWGQVFSNLVNTGIYIISPRVLSEIPTGKFFDFAKDLFPKLLSAGRPVYGVEMKGYWCDIGDTDAYRRCVVDALNGVISLQAALPKSENGIYGREGMPILPKDVVLTPPLYIAPSAKIMPGAKIGPNVVLGPSAYVGEESIVTDSLVEGSIGPRCEVDGTILCPGATVGAGSVLQEGSVIGSGVRLGEDCHVAQGVRIFPDVTVPQGTRVRHTIVKGSAPKAVFENNVITGRYGHELSPDLCVAIGQACAGLMEGGPARVAVGGGVSADATSLVYALAGGLASAGCQVFFHDIPFAAGAAALPKLASCSLSLFVENDEHINLHIFDKNGIPLSSAAQRKLEGMVARGEGNTVSSLSVGKITMFTGGVEYYAAMAASQGKAGRGLSVAVHGGHPAAAALSKALTAAGFTLPLQPALSFSGLTISVARSGFAFAIADGNVRCEGARALALVLLAAFMDEPGLKIALPYEAPMTFDVLAAQNGGEILRLGRDEGAEQLYASQPFTRDAVFGALRLLSFLSASGSSLATLASMLPPFFEHTVEIPCETDKSAVMRMLTESCRSMNCELVGGLRIGVDGGYVRITPSASKRALRVAAESFSAEVARELAVNFADRAMRFDKPTTFEKYTTNTQNGTLPPS
jgi:mannose-1-phosphate guanylyltransferase/phosphomannomutase